MTTSLDSPTRQDLKTRLGSLVDAFLAENPTVLESYRAAVAAVMENAPATGAAVSAPESASELEAADQAAMEAAEAEEALIVIDESGADLDLILGEVAPAVDDAAPPAIDVPAPPVDEADPTEEVDVDETTLDEIFENGPTDKQIDLMRSAGLAMTIEYV